MASRERFGLIAGLALVGGLAGAGAVHLSARSKQ